MMYPGSPQHGFSLIEVMVVVIVIGVLAVIALPSFVRYTRRARTVEAANNLRRLYDSSLTYWQAEHASPDQKLVPHQFPAPASETPAINACCGQPGNKCDPQRVAATWDTPTWSALHFSVDDPFYFWYRYDSSGSGSSSNFSAWAFGNLDCDASYSTFMRGGHVDPTSHIISGGSGLYIQNETE